MAKSIYFAAATLDGFIADPDGGLDWLTGFEPSYEGPGEDVNEAIDAFMETVGVIVMGSSTYEFILAHGSWAYGERPTWVLTSRELPVAEGADVRFHDGPVADIHPEMLAAAGERDLWVMGGAPVASPLADAGLLDELHVTVVPVVLGAGKPLFETPIERPMRLLGTRTFSSGMVELRYSLTP
ncbi:MAG: dihydrofolate reductase family protein [Solirubrobacterales bacterium]